jgi:hypothetical protein
MNKTIISICLTILTVAGLLFSCSDHNRKDHLKQGFINPPDSSKPGVYWYFMDGNINREAMTEDLESMKEAGIAYVVFLEVNVGIPRGKVDFLSEEWQDLYNHAVREAERLGIRIILGSGPGWAGSGGPWVTPAQSMTHLVASETMVTGPVEFSSILPLPMPMKPFFGEGSLSPSLKKLRDEWYEDVVVLAFPTPEGSSRITNVEEKALYYRAPYTSQPGVLPYIPETSSVNKITTSAIDRGKIVDLTDRLNKDGSLSWNVPAGKWTILRFGKRNNGAVTRPAPEPGLGFEADKFDTASFDDHYYQYIGKLLNKVQPEKNKSGGGWTMIHIDSWEMGSQNWSPHFREEFKLRRGYDPVLFLPTYKGLIVSSSEISERFLWDIRQTSNELIIQNHAGRFKELGRRSGFRLSIEPYDMNPASDLDLGSVADVPMCEFWSDGYGFNSSFSCIESTSIAHITGAPVVAAEAFTADHTEAWKNYPGIMKNQGDWAFCMGINRLVYHTFAHKPLPDQFRPGMTMGPYGVHWDRGQTWWPMAEAYHRYISRCQYILSQGNAVSDILYLTPEGAPHVFLPPASALEGTTVLPDKKGYSFDGCSPMLLMKYASVKNGNIVFPGGASYKIMVLPQIKNMTPELVEKIGSLVNAGATIVGNPPVKSPSLVNYPECDKQVKELAEKIWGSEEMPASLELHKSGSGIVWWGEKLEKSYSENSSRSDSLNLYPDYQTIISLLDDMEISADFTSSGNIRFIHKALSDRDIYFISNRTGSVVIDTCKFRNGTMNAELWDPVTGKIKKVACYRTSANSTSVKIRLEAFQSYFVVFYHQEKGDKSLPVETFNPGEILLTLEGPWEVAFDTTWGGPEKIVSDTLFDWSERPENGVKYYSGTATYTTSFDLPENTGIKKGKRYFIDLGILKNLGKVKLNGKETGVVWTSPWQAEISGILKIKENILEIQVVNLWVNRLVGDETFPWDGIEDGKWPAWLLNGTDRESKRYTFTTHRYYTKDDNLQESGLIGPVTIKEAD